MHEFYIIGQNTQVKMRVRNKITKKVKQYSAYTVVDGKFFIRFEKIFLPKLFYEVMK